MYKSDNISFEALLIYYFVTLNFLFISRLIIPNFKYFPPTELVKTSYRTFRKIARSDFKILYVRPHLTTWLHWTHFNGSRHLSIFRKICPEEQV
jgi:hypothetical protein